MTEFMYPEQKTNILVNAKIFIKQVIQSNELKINNHMVGILNRLNLLGGLSKLFCGKLTDYLDEIATAGEHDSLFPYPGGYEARNSGYLIISSLL